jgi:hypothetical protein
MGRVRRLGEQGADRRLQLPGGRQRILVGRLRDVGIGVEHGGLVDLRLGGRRAGAERDQRERC